MCDTIRDSNFRRKNNKCHCITNYESNESFVVSL